MRTVVAIAGSLRRGSYNRLLLQAAARRAPSTMVLSLYDELGEIPLFNEDLEQGGSPEVVARFRDRIAAADGMLIATPEYNQSIPGVLKNAIDWLSRPAPHEVLIRKPVAVIGATGGRWGTRLAQASLRQVLTATEALVLPSPVLYARDAATLFNDDGALIDQSIGAALDGVLLAFRNWIELVSPAR